MSSNYESQTDHTFTVRVYIFFIQKNFSLDWQNKKDFFILEKKL